MIIITEDEVKQIKERAKRLPNFMKDIRAVYIVEAFATFVYTYGVCCSVFIHPFKKQIPNPYGIFLISSFLYFALSIAAPFSGGHLNPAVTMTMYFGKKIVKQRIKYYIVAQLAGALLGAACAYLSFDIIPAAYVAQDQISWSMFVDGIGSFFGSFIFTFFVLYALDTNYMRGDYFMYFFFSLMFLVGRMYYFEQSRFTFRKSYINPAQIFALQIFAAIDHKNFFLAFWGLWLIIGSLLGGVASAFFYRKFYLPLMQQIQQKG